MKRCSLASIDRGLKQEALSHVYIHISVPEGGGRFNIARGREKKVSVVWVVREIHPTTDCPGITGAPYHT